MSIELPMGFGMALSRDLDAMSYFTALSESKQKEIIANTHSIKSKQEMRDYVSKLHQK